MDMAVKDGLPCYLSAIHANVESVYVGVLLLDSGFRLRDKRVAAADLGRAKVEMVMACRLGMTRECKGVTGKPSRTR